MTQQPHIEHEDLSQPRTLREYLRLYFTGFAMGAADIVPGVSGGTMAFILGVYETLINAIKSFDITAIRKALKFDVQGVIEHIPFRFLIALGLGVGSAIILLASLLHTLLEDQPTFIFAFFAGLIVASILAIGIKVKWSSTAIAALLIAGVVAFVIVGIGAEDDPVDNLVTAVEDGAGVDSARADLIAALVLAEVENPSERAQALILAVESDQNVKAVEDTLNEDLYQPSSPIILFFSGMIAICAMLLPGISGSFILLILGQYTIVLNAVKTVDIISVGAVGLGAGVGVIAFSRVISWLLKHYENATIAALVGFMTGSLRLIYSEASKGVDVVSADNALSGGQIALVVALMLFGFVLVSFLDHLQSRRNPVFAWTWKPAPAIDSIAEKAEALD
jgi:putative membrane protein